MNYMQGLAGLWMHIFPASIQFDPGVWFFRKRPIIKEVRQRSEGNKGDLYGTPEQIGVAG